MPTHEKNTHSHLHTPTPNKPREIPRFNCPQSSFSLSINCVITFYSSRKYPNSTEHEHPTHKSMFHLSCSSVPSQSQWAYIKSVRCMYTRNSSKTKSSCSCFYSHILCFLSTQVLSMCVCVRSFNSPRTTISLAVSISYFYLIILCGLSDCSDCCLDIYTFSSKQNTS